MAAWIQRFLGRRAQDVFRFHIHRDAHTLKPSEERETRLSALETLELDGVDLDEDTSDDISVGDERGDLSILNPSTNYFICPLRAVRRIPRRVSVFLINRPRSLPVRRRAVAVDLL